VPPTHADFLQRSYFEGLNGIRCVAIVAVVWHHSVGFFPLPIFSRGFLGVDLFFILSGFLITTLLLREKTQTGDIDLKAFWVRRFLRLMPAYYGMLLTLLAVYLVFKPHDPHTQALAKGFPVYALYLSNWINPGAVNLGPTWSLATEEQFYLFWPPIEAFVSQALGAIVWVAALVVNQLINFGALDGVIQSVFGIAPGQHPEILQTTFTPILLGVGLAHVMNSRRGYEGLQKWAGFPHATAVLALLLLALLNIALPDISGLPRLTLHVLATLFLAAILFAPSSRTTRLLESRPAVFVGTISYGIYLYHLFALHGARAILAKLSLPEFPSLFLIGLALSIVMAAASYYLYEVHFLRLRHRFRAAPVAARATGAP
jgi:peptidoglycan/LPS O-acetylase OafA/YrhL